MTDFEKFIIDNANADTARLMLSNKKWPVPEDFSLARINAKDIAINTIEARKKLRKKVPEWWAQTDMIYPTALCAEQCSSSATAEYKAEIARKILNEYLDEGISPSNAKTTAEPEKVIADLTGGLGVDSMAFSKVVTKVLYNEMNPALAEAARHNFKVLGISRIAISCKEVKPGSLTDILGETRPGIIYLDPGRRGTNGYKFFELEDCQPNVLKLLPELFHFSRNVLLKLSPMADISLITNQLNHCYEEYSEKTFGTGWNCNWIREIHVVANGGECKELLVWMDRNWNGETTYFCSEDGNVLTFSQEDIRGSKATLPDSTYMKFLFEPGKSLTKAGASNVLCSRFGLVKLGKFTHLFTTGKPLSDSELEAKENSLRPYGKIFSVKEILPFEKASMKKIKNDYPHSEVAAMNIPLSSDELRNRLGVKSGDDAMIFGARIETPALAKNYLIVCNRQ